MADAAALERVLVGPDDPEIVALEAAKAEDLAAHRSGALRVREHEPEELRIRRVGSDVAIVALRTKAAYLAKRLRRLMPRPARATASSPSEPGSGTAMARNSDSE